MDDFTKEDALTLETTDGRDKEERQSDAGQTALHHYAGLHLAMAKRMPTWTKYAGQENEIAKALDAIYAALAAASPSGSLCVTLAQVMETASAEGGAPSEEALAKDIALLLAAGLMVEVKEAVSGKVPLVFDREGQLGNSRIYFQRYFKLEADLAAILFALAAPYVAGQASFDRLEDLVPEGGERKRAIETALKSRLTVISGGPGTGKTTAVSGILECLLAADQTVRIVLAAPTGKAAGRMLESIQNAISNPAMAGQYGRLKAKSRELVARTMHKWLVDEQLNGLRPSAGRPLDCDVLVVDEASMIDIGLAVDFLSVVDAKRTRVILLGDPDQLSAVGPGSVLGDICSAESPLRQRGLVAELTKSHRFPPESVFGQLAIHIKAGEATISTAGSGIVDCLTAAPPKVGLLTQKASQWIDAHMQSYAQALSRYVDDHDLDALWACAKRSQALAAVRNGKMSVEAINRHAARSLREALENLGRGWFSRMSGQPIIVRKNNSVLDIHNGDVGIILPQRASATGGTQVYFGDSRRMLPLGSLPQYELAFCITIHQSQGSEYEDIAVFLPPSGKDDGLLATKELLYTAVTRVKAAKDGSTGQVTLFGERPVYEASVTHPTQRTSGLIVRLKEAFAGR